MYIRGVQRGDLFDEKSRGGKSLRLSVQDIVQRALTARMWYQSTRRGITHICERRKTMENNIRKAKSGMVG